MNEYSALVLAALVSYFVIIDPIGVALIFNALTKDQEVAHTRRVAVRSVLLSFGVVVAFGLFGGALLDQLGIAMDSFRIAGGLLLFSTAFQMVTSAGGIGDTTSGEPEDISVYPLSFPLMAGPGCLTLTILLVSDAREQSQGLTPILVALVLVFGTTLVCFLTSNFIVRVIGKTVNSVIKRLLGVLLAALSIQFIAVGVRGFVE